MDAPDRGSFPAPEQGNRVSAKLDSELLVALHRGPLDQPLWGGFLSRLRARLGSDYCGLFFREPAAPLSEATELASVLPAHREAKARWLDGLHRLDPVPWASLRPGRVYGLNEFLDENRLEHVRYRQTFLEPAGRRYQRFVRVEADGMAVTLLVWRAHRDFRASDAALLARLVPHLTISLTLYATIERERRRAGISGDAVRRLNFGWLVLDAQARVIEHDALADELLRNSAVLALRRDARLVPSSPQAHRALDEVLKDFAGNPAARPRAIRLSEEPWVDMLLRPIAERGPALPTRAVATAYLHGDRESSAARVEQLMQMFGLTASEARLSVALTRGHSIAEAAELLGIGVETARGYSKAVYAKVGARGQADLMRILLASATRLA